MHLNCSGLRETAVVANELIVTFLAILASSAIALPLAPSHPSSELRYMLNDSAATVVMRRLDRPMG